MIFILKFMKINYQIQTKLIFYINFIFINKIIFIFIIIDEYAFINIR